MTAAFPSVRASGRRATSRKEPVKLLDQVRDLMRLRHYSLSMEESYVQWIRRFIVYHHKGHRK
jgi:hypothetical protein